MSKNMEDTEALLQTSSNINELAKDFEKNADEMLTIQKDNSFWACSCKCILMFVGIGVVIALLILIIMWIF